MERYRAWTVEVCNDFHGPTRTFIGADRVPVCAICHRPTSRVEVVPAERLRGAVDRVAELERSLGNAVSDLRAEGHWQAAERAYRTLANPGRAVDDA